MRYRELLLATLLAVSGVAESSRAVAAAQSGALISIQGMIVHVDRARGRVVLRYAPLETAPGGMRTCLVADRKVLAGLKVGETIAALADTSRSQWRLRRIHILY
jgi:Cu/Ag efflux protein CusF